MTALEEAATAATYALADLDEMQNYVTEDLQRFATAALEAAMPHVEAAIRQEVVDDIRAVAESYPSNHLRSAFRELARIVEEGNSK